MRKHLTSITCLIALLLSMILPSHAQATAPLAPQAQLQVSVELAYVRDGNIWLLNLFTRESKQLTNDGDNRWPTWSNDGRYLLYTHSKSEDTADLYIWELDHSVKPILLVEDACCAAWDPMMPNAVAYIALAGQALAIERVHPDGSGKETLFAPLQYGRSTWPAGNMSWVLADGEAEIFVPLEVIDSSVQQGLATYTTILTLSNMKAESDPIDNSQCSIVNKIDVTIKSNKDIVSAVAFTGSAGCNVGTIETTSRKGILIEDANADNLELPWLAYPSWFPDSRILAAERYIEASDPEKAELEGIVFHDLVNNNEQLLVEGGAQPAWRPMAPMEPVIASYLSRLDEVAVAIQPALTWQGATYRAYYITTGSYVKTTAQLFAVATPEFFSSQGIPALIVTKDGEIVTDVEMLRQVFLLYTASYYLYEQPPDEVISSMHNELGKVLDNPIFQGMAESQLLPTRHDQTTETLRAILTDQVSEKNALEPLFKQAFEAIPKQAEDALDAFSVVLENNAAHDPVLLALKSELAAAHGGLADAVKGNKYQLQLVRLALQLLFTSHLQVERGDWLQTYADAFPQDVGSLDRDQLRGAADVLEEVKKSAIQRIDIVTAFITEMGQQGILDQSGDVAAKAAGLMARLVGKFGMRISTNVMADNLSAASVGVTLDNLLYGTETLFTNFTLAQRAEELRTTFHAGREALQDTARFEKQNMSNVLVYNGDLAAQFRVAYLLETLATVQTQRAYSDGVVATFQLPNPMQLINWLRGEDWKKHVEDKRKTADEMETTVLNQVGAPAYLETAIRLALSRTDPNREVAKVGDDTITVSDFWKRTKLEKGQLQSQLVQMTQLEEQFGGQGFFTQQINQIQSTLSSPFALGMQVLNKMIDEKVIAQQATTLGIAVTDEEVDEALREEIANRRSYVTDPQATATVQVALEATATAASWTPTPTPTLDTSLKASPTPLPTPEPLPTRAVLTDTGYTEGLTALQEDLEAAAGMSLAEYREVVRARLLSDKVSKAIGEQEVAATEEQVHARHILLNVIEPAAGSAATPGPTAEGAPAPTPTPAPRSEAETLALATKLRNRILAGEKFEDIAAQYSNDTSNAQNGGDLGWFGRGAMVPAFEEAAFTLPIGQISEPITTSFGVHLIEVLEKDPAHTLDEQTLAQKRQEAYQVWLQEQINATKIERPEDLTSNLPPITVYD